MQIHLKPGSAASDADRWGYCLEPVIKLFYGIYFIGSLKNINIFFPFNVPTLINILIY